MERCGSCNRFTYFRLPCCYVYLCNTCCVELYHENKDTCPFCEENIRSYLLNLYGVENKDIVCFFNYYTSEEDEE